MENKIRRPPSVWIAQTIVFSLAFVFLVPMPWILVDSGAHRFGALPVAFPVPAAIYSVVALLFLVSFWGLMVRRSYGRWMAVGILTVVFAVLLFMWTLMAFYTPASAKPSMIVYVELTLIVALTLFLILRLALGKRVAAFFNQRNLQPPVHEPPPPPTSFEN